MNLLPNKSITLLELIIAISLFGVLVLAFLSIDQFSNYHLRNTDIRVRVQNEAAFVLEHMAKEVAQAIGNPTITGQEPINTGVIGADRAITVWVDSDNDGIRDKRIAYRFPTSGGSLTPFSIFYCQACQNSPCTNCNPNWSNDGIIARNITDFDYTVTDNYVNIELQACHVACAQPGNACDCRNTNSDNPLVEMTTSIKMLGVSLN